MVRGKPPHRSKSAGEPVTADPDVQDITPGEAPEDQNKHQVSATEAGTAGVPGAGIDIAGAAVAEAETAEATTTETKIDNAPNEAQSETEAAPAADTTFAGVREDTSPAPSAPPPRRSSSSLVAAGIFGGLVALAGAGSMQYAGLLASLSPAPAPAIDTSGLTTEIETLKQQVASLEAQPRPDSTALEGRIAALETAAQAAPPSGGVDPAVIDDLEQKVTALNTGIDQLKSEIASAAEARTSRTAEIAKRLDEVETKLDEPRNDIVVARAVALASLKAAVDRGGPFLAELDTFAGVAPEDPAIGGLKPFAAAGVPSRAELMRQFPDAASAILVAIHQPDPDEGIAGRLMGSALSLVKVRPVGNVEGEGPEAVVARIEDKLKNGDLKGAALEWANLPEAGKGAASTFKTALDNRLKVEELVDTAMKTTTATTTNEG